MTPERRRWLLSIAAMVDAIDSQLQTDLEYFIIDKAERRYLEALDALAVLIKGEK